MQSRPGNLLPFASGAAVAVGARAVLRQALLVHLRRAVRALNAGDHHPLLAGYSEAAVLRFTSGEHRWAGEHHGRAAIERFLREFTRAGPQGEIRDLWVVGPLASTIAPKVRMGAAVRQPDGARRAHAMGPHRQA